MSTSLILPTKRQLSGAKPKSSQPRPGIIRQMRERQERKDRETALAARAALARRGAPAQCPNKSCPKPNVVDGTCQTCGRVVDDTNIVAEVQFDEASNGAAVVQGSYLGADQAGPRGAGPGFRRGLGFSDERERSIREARSLMVGFAQRLNLGDSVVSAGVQAFKLASSANFIQGRTLASVAAVCLYAACRNEPPCKIMLIDLADLVQVNVFRIGRIFKKLNEAVPICNEGMTPVYPEDLIFRFASKLEFGEKTHAVAEDAVRLVKRMGRDWMVMGRRPSGICGACLLMAARMHNFRRTVCEVVYIVKVTNHTIQLRLEEFKATESSAMTVEDFLTQDFLESSHDPPSFYRNTNEWRRKLEARQRGRSGEHNKRKRGAQDDGEAGPAGGPSSAEAHASPPLSPAAAKGPDLSSVPELSFRRDAEGFIIPPLPSQIDEIRQKGLKGLLEIALLSGESGKELDDLARQHGDQAEEVGGGDDDNVGDDNVGDDKVGDDKMGDDKVGDDKVGDDMVGDDNAGEDNVDDDNVGNNMSDDGSPEAAPPKKGRRNRAPQIQLPVDQDWERDEQDLENTIDEIFNDPETWQHAVAYGTAEQRARIHAVWALQQQPRKPVSMAAEVGEDEFAADPEVVHCLLTPEEVQIKECVWVNENKDWLRKQQEKIYRRKLEAGRPKQTRKRRKRPRIGEGQTEPASSPGEAAITGLKRLAMSKRINYAALGELFEQGIPTPAPTPVPSAAASRDGSVADDRQPPRRIGLFRPAEPGPDLEPEPGPGPSIEQADVDDGGGGQTGEYYEYGGDDGGYGGVDEDDY